MEEIQSIDVWILVIAGVSVLLAYHRGFTAEMLKLGVYVLSITSGIYLAPFCAPLFESFASHPKLSVFLSFFSGALLSWIVLKVIAGQMMQAVRKSSLSKLDKSLGIIFGLIRGFMLVLILYFLVCLFSPGKEEEYRKNSRLFNLVGVAADNVRGRLAEEFDLEIPQNLKSLTKDDEQPEKAGGPDAEKPPAAEVNEAVENGEISGRKAELMMSLLEKAKKTKLKTSRGEESLLEAAVSMLAESYLKSSGGDGGKEQISHEDMMSFLNSSLEGPPQEVHKKDTDNRLEKQGLTDRDIRVLRQLIKEKKDAENTRN